MRDLAAQGYRAETGDTWRPRNGSHSSQSARLTSAAIDARDYLRARKDRRDRQRICPRAPWSPLPAARTSSDVAAIWRSLDSVRVKYADMVLLHGGGPGAEKIAARWAEKHGVAPGRVQAGLEPRRQGRPLPAQRRRC